MKRVAIQGFEGSFHQMAVQQYYGSDTGILACATFRELIQTIQNNKDCDGGLMAIENSIAGSILPNYNLLRESNLAIIGEVYLEIGQNLLVNKGVTLADIKEVHSHPMAILQCLDFLDQHRWKIVETEDTALSAKHIHQYNSKHIAAIASSLAAELYHLDVLCPGIHSIKNNYTRFLVLARHAEAQPVPKANKASVYFHVENKKGSLANVLQTIAAGGVNLSKLQSFPIPGSNWLYSFHADMEFNTRSDFEQVLQAIQPVTDQFKVYGIYRNGQAKP